MLRMHLSRRDSILPALVAAAAIFATVGCQASAASKPGYKPGELGNGGFLFQCDDSVACERSSKDATKFPAAVSLGAPFTVRYELVTSPSTINIRINESDPNKGITVQTVGNTFLSSGPDGFVGLKAGYATLASRDSAGSIVDYVTVRVDKPDAIVVYDASDTSLTPARIDTLSLAQGARRAYRAVAQKKSQDLAGALRVEWTSSDPSVVKIDNVSGVKVTVSALKAGAATLTAVGGTFTQQIPVEVSQ